MWFLELYLNAHGKIYILIEADFILINNKYIVGDDL